MCCLRALLDQMQMYSATHHIKSPWPAALWETCQIERQPNPKPRKESQHPREDQRPLLGRCDAREPVGRRDEPREDHSRVELDDPAVCLQHRQPAREERGGEREQAERGLREQVEDSPRWRASEGVDDAVDHADEDEQANASEIETEQPRCRRLGMRAVAVVDG